MRCSSFDRQTAAGLSLGPAAFAAVVFAILPMQSESVAWVTGRVDSMPACFYLLSFFLYERWRAGARASLYIWSVIACFVALFTKQNAVTLPATLLLYDAIVGKHPVRPSWNWIRPYVPFVLLTAGYLALRYALFGEVARESSLNEVRFNLFLDNVSIHLKRMVFGEAGVALSDLNALVRVGAAAAIVGAVAALARDYTRAMIRPALYFLVVWIALGFAPTLVAGYGSPRHMYLASVGWALFLGIALGAFWHARVGPLGWTTKAAGGVFATAVLVVYGAQLRAEVRLWGIRSEVSHRIVQDLEHETMSAPRGSLVLVDPPPRSWNFALPFALRPPFTREDLPNRVLVISHSSIHCCAANYLGAVHQAYYADMAGEPGSPAGHRAPLGSRHRCVVPAERLRRAVPALGGGNVARHTRRDDARPPDSQYHERDGGERSQAGTPSTILTTDVVGTTRFNRNPALAKSDAYSASVRSCPPGITIMTRS